jgi:mono/diheme cytochrome c family protein
METFLGALTLAAALWAQQAQAPFTPRSLSAFERGKVESLLRDKYPCLGCHQLRGTGGKIGPDLTGLRTRRSPGFVYAMITDPQRTVPGTIMPRVPLPAGAAEQLASYLVQGTGPAVPESPRSTAPAPAAAAPPADGASLYGRYCAACHGPDGRGDGPNAENLPVRPAALAAAAAMSGRPDDALFDTIFAGGLVMNRSNFMPPFGRTLAPVQIRALVRHIRALCGCEGPAWSRDGFRPGPADH